VEAVGPGGGGVVCFRAVCGDGEAGWFCGAEGAATVAVNEYKEAQKKDENGEHDKARYEQVLLARL